MRLALPILLLMALPAMAQPQADKPFIHDAPPGGALRSFQAPTPVTILPETSQTPRPLPEASFQDDRRSCAFQPPGPVTIGPGPSNSRTPTPLTNMALDCDKPDEPKPPAKGAA